MVHRIDQFFACDLVYRPWPAPRLLMNAHDLLFREAFQPPASTLEAQRQVFPGFILFIRLQRNRVKALLTIDQGLQPRQQGFLAKQKHMRPAFRATCRQAQQGLNGRTGQPLGVVDQ